MAELTTLFQDVREALETLGSEAANGDDLTGSEIANEGIAALAKIETRLRSCASAAGNADAAEGCRQVIRIIKETVGDDIPF